MVWAALRQAFTQLDHQNATRTMRHAADQLRDKWPKLGAFIDDSETGVLASMNIPARHRVKIHSTNPIGRLNKEAKRRADVVGTFPNEGAIIRLVGAVLLEANDEWQPRHRYMQTEAMAEVTRPTIDAVPTEIATADLKLTALNRRRRGHPTKHPAPAGKKASPAATVPIGAR